MTLSHRYLSGAEVETDTRGVSHKQVDTFIYHTLSAHLDPFKASGKQESYESGELKRSEEQDIEDKKLEELEYFSFVITPMLYFAL